MNIPGNIGECILIKGVIEKITIEGADNIVYGIRLLDGTTIMHYINKEDILFKNADSIVAEAVINEPKKTKRGRPRKATAEDLIMKAEKYKEDLDGIKRSINSTEIYKDSLRERNNQDA